MCVFSCTEKQGFWDSTEMEDMGRAWDRELLLGNFGSQPSISLLTSDNSAASLRKWVL